jgi:hypothetical protein
MADPKTTLQTAPIRMLKQSDIAACPFAIMLSSHYRADGTCKCSNAEHRQMMIAEWEYDPDDFKNVPLVD